MNRLQGKVAIVTGSALGIGHATSLLLAREGATVAVTDLKNEEGEALVRDIHDAGGSAVFWQLDVSDESAVEHVFSEVRARFGRVDILVNNAGISGVDKPTDKVTEEEWDKVISVNVKGVFLCTKHIIRYLRETDSGSIINLSSIYGLVGAPDIPAYHASKGAVRLMTKTDALLYAKDGIRVNSVHPGYIWTPLVENLAEVSGQDTETFRENLEKLHPLGHIGEPEDIAFAVLFLASDESKFMTGSELVIDGGYTAQ